MANKLTYVRVLVSDRGAKVETKELDVIKETDKLYFVDPGNGRNKTKKIFKRLIETNLSIIKPDSINLQTRNGYCLPENKDRLIEKFKEDVRSVIESNYNTINKVVDNYNKLNEE